ncbi:MAG: OmpH family outer membrane protein [Armatimonadota bacterium]|jgi:Skp family chaperone for outer membrane proteins
MLRRFGRAVFLLAGAIAVVGLAGSAVLAAPNDIKIGVVDLQKVYRDAPRVKQYREQLEDFSRSLATKLDIRSQNMMLNEDEIKELIDLKTKEKPTEAESSRAKQLSEIERAKDEELRKLQETKELNDQQQARLKELQGLQQKSKDIGAALAKDYDGQYQAKMAELETKSDSDIQDAVNKTAEAKGLTLVLDKAVVFLGGVDITDDVVSRLDRKAQ